MFIRITPAFRNGAFNIKEMKYVKADHFDFFFKLNSVPNLNEKIRHWNLAVFERDKRVQDRILYHTEGKTQILMFDFDLKNKSDKTLPSNNEIIQVKDQVISYYGLQKKSLSTVVTGGGFHFYLFLDKFFYPQKESWMKSSLRLFKDKMVSNRFEIDLNSFSTKRTIRLPASLYSKEGRETIQTKLFYGTKDLFSFEMLREKFRDLKEEEKVKTETEQESLKNIQKWKDIDYEAVIGTVDEPWSGCRFLRWSVLVQKEVNYEEWIAQISLTSRMFKDEDVAYEFSKQFSSQDPRFNEEEFENKFNESLKNMYPASCNHISKIWKYSDNKQFGCVTCPHKQSNMPLTISYYSNKDTGFRHMQRKKTGQSSPVGINYKSFVNFIMDKENIRMERDETPYKYDENENFFREKTLGEIIDNNKKLIVPYVQPNEIGNIKSWMKAHRIFNFEDVDAKQKNYIFFKNGALNIKSGVLEKFSPTKFINTYCLNFNYDINSICPLYESVLEFAFGEDKQHREFFLNYMALSLFERARHEKALILFGDGANGKSTLMNGINNMFHNDSSIITSIDFDEFKKDTSHFAFLRKARIAYSSDVSPSSFRRNSDFMKKLISGEILNYRKKYASVGVQFHNQANIVVGMNLLPEFKETTTGLKRRFFILPFMNTMPDEQRDIHLTEKLKSEGSGIFNLLYSQFLNAKKNKIKLALDNELIEEVFKVENIHYNFIEDCFEVTENEEDIVYSSDIYDKYKQYYYEHSVGQRDLLPRMKFTRHFYTQNRNRIERVRIKNVRGFRFIKFKKETYE